MVWRAAGTAARQPRGEGSNPGALEFLAWGGLPARCSALRVHLARLGAWRALCGGILLFALFQGQQRIKLAAQTAIFSFQLCHFRLFTQARARRRRTLWSQKRAALRSGAWCWAPWWGRSATCLRCHAQGLCQLPQPAPHPRCRAVSGDRERAVSGQDPVTGVGHDVVLSRRHCSGSVGDNAGYDTQIN
jgi:hypothetical protein